MRGTLLTGPGLVEQAHRAAVGKGFWESASVPEKVALIHTEVDEFEELVFPLPDRLADTPEERGAQDAAREATSAAALEELADVVLRVADLCGHLGISLPPRALLETRYYEGAHYQRLRDYPHFMHRAAARTTRAHRAGELGGVSEQLREIVGLAATLSGLLYGHRSLERAVAAKMEKNRFRPRKHGRSY